jgi:hypothetical protein
MPFNGSIFYRVPIRSSKRNATSLVTRGKRRSTVCQSHTETYQLAMEFKTWLLFCVWLVICFRIWLPTVLTWDLGKRSSGLKKAYPYMRGELQRKLWLLYGVKTAIKPQRSSQLCFSEICGQSWNCIILPRSVELDRFQRVSFFLAGNVLHADCLSPDALPESLITTLQTRKPWKSGWR